MIERLASEGLLVKSEMITHMTPVCERSKTPIEIIPMEEYYLKQTEFLEDLRRLAYKMEFLPEQARQLYIDWVNSVTIDWPVSRRRYYATEIPVWYCKSCGYTYVADDGEIPPSMEGAASNKQMP
jgi:valyl-tRNA synthetase